MRILKILNASKFLIILFGQEWFKIFFQMILQDCQHNSPSASEKIVTYLDEAIEATGQIPGRIAAGFWHLAGRLGRFAGGSLSSRPLSSTSSVIPASTSMGTREPHRNWTKLDSID